jgi:hypothetical protein
VPQGSTLALFLEGGWAFLLTPRAPESPVSGLLKTTGQKPRSFVVVARLGPVALALLLERRGR